MISYSAKVCNSMGVNKSFNTLLWKAVNHSSLLMAKIPSSVPQIMKSAGISLRVDAERDADRIFYEDYHSNQFFSQYHSSVFPKFQIPNVDATLI